MLIAISAIVPSTFVVIPMVIMRLRERNELLVLLVPMKRHRVEETLPPRTTDSCSPIT